MFLLAAEDYRKLFEKEEATPAAAGAGYKQFIAIVDEYIRVRSPYEVNIESRVKGEILRTTDKGIFDDLTMVRASTKACPRRPFAAILCVNTCVRGA